MDLQTWLITFGSLLWLTGIVVLCLAISIARHRDD